jgi:hypothetical protein
VKKILALAILIPSLALAGRDAQGTWTFSADVYPVRSGTKITASWANSLMDSLAAGLTASLCRDENCGAMNAPFYFGTGSVGAPGVAFSSYNTTGLFVTGTGDAPFLNVSVGAQQTLKIGKTSLYFNTYKMPLFHEAVFFFPGKMINNQLLARIAVTTRTEIQAGLAGDPGEIGYVAFAGTDPASPGNNANNGTGGIVYIKKRTAVGATTVPGWLIWTPGQNAASSVEFPAAAVFDPGDFIELWGPAAADADFADVSITLRVRRK